MRIIIELDTHQQQGLQVATPTGSQVYTTGAAATTEKPVDAGPPKLSAADQPGMIPLGEAGSLPAESGSAGAAPPVPSF